MNTLAAFSNQYVLIAILVGAASGVVGAYVILRRMALVGDALSHVALPGIAIALAAKVDPFFGALAFLLTAAVIVWWLEGKTKLPGDAIVGVLFTASLAAGILGLPGEEILDSLFGAFPPLGPVSFLLVAAAAVAVIVLMVILTRRVLFSIAAPELAALADPQRRSTLLFLLLFAFVVALGIKLVGTLLMGALVIIPAAFAKNISRSMTAYVVLAGLAGGFIAGTGTWLAARFSVAPGPAIILLGVVLFIGTLVLPRE